MQIFYIITAVYLLTNNVGAICISSSFMNVRMRVCNAQFCVDQAVTGCVDNSRVFPDATGLTIQEKFSRLRIGAINNLPQLEYISAENAGIRGINTYCLQQLPNLKLFNVQANEIEDIPWGIFTGSNIEYITFQRNKISVIDNYAFSDMPLLKTLDLSMNRIAFINQMWFINTTSIEELNLSHNRLTTIWYNNFRNFTNLKRLELQFNKIQNIRSQAFNMLTHFDFLDLTNNELCGISDDMFNLKDYPNTSISEIRIGINNISFVPKQFFRNIKIGKIILHPNPWHCDCLYDITTASSTGLFATQDPKPDAFTFWNTSYPVCAFPSEDASCHYNFYEDSVVTLSEYFKRIDYNNFIKFSYNVQEICPREEYF